jgi:putative nucleotidyltransferase with HDIG domain
MKKETPLRNLSTKNSDEIIHILQEIKQKQLEVDARELLPLLKYDNKGIKEMVKEMLISCGDKSIVDNLILHLGDRDPEYRNLVVEILYYLVDQNLPSIGNLLKNKDEDIKIYACQILAYSKNPKSLDYLKEALKSDNPNVRNSAVMALDKTELSFNPGFLMETLNTEKEEWVRFSILEVMGGKGKYDKLDYLFPMLDSEPDYIQINIINIFGDFGDLDTLEKLSGFAKSFKGNVFSAYAKCMFTIINRFEGTDISSKPKTMAQLEKILEEDGQPWNIYQAIRIVSSIRTKKYLKLFKKKLNHPHPLVRIAAIEALAAYPDEDLDKTLDDFLKDPSPEVRERVHGILNSKNNWVRTDRQKLRKEILAKVNITDNLPVMPNIAIEVMSYVDDEHTSLKDIAAIISRDPSLTAQVLKVANSAFYGLRQAVGSLELAIVLLGLREIKNIIFMMSIVKLFPKDKKFSFNKIDYLKHSLLTAQTSKMLTDSLGLKFNSEPFITGLLHDIGKVFLDQNFHQRYNRVLEEASKGKTFLYLIEQDHLGIDHAEVGASIASMWNFPLEMIEGIRYHHDIEKIPGDKSLPCVIHLSSLLTNARNIGLPFPTAGIPINEDPAWKFICNSKDVDIEKILFEIDDELRKSEEILDIYYTKLGY